MTKLFILQIIEHDKYVKMAERQQTMRYKILARRGEIYMMDRGEPSVVAMNRKVWMLIIDPMSADETTVTEKLAKYVKEGTDFKKVFENKQSRYFLLARSLDQKTAEEIRKLKLNGVWLTATTKREYPEAEMGARMLGFVNVDGEGQYGVEGALNKELKGEDGLMKTVKDINNIPLTIGNDNVRIPAKNGKNIVLSIDKNVQYATEKALRKVMGIKKVSRGSAVVMDPRTGKILAMAELPSYNPAEYEKVQSAENYVNGATMVAYEPASVCKTFAFAAGIETGAIRPETTFYNSDETIVDGWPIRNASRGHTGEITMRTALDWSLNTGSTQVLRLMGGEPEKINLKGKKLLYDYYGDFGLGKETGVELFETVGTVVPPEAVNGTNARYANMTFGQGMNLTMIQVLAGFAAVVNGGEYYRPTVVEGELMEGKLLKKEGKRAERKVVSGETSRTMREMLVSARRLYQGTKEWDEELMIGGKTGTAQVLKDGKYIMEETVGSYVGFGARSEAELPEYVIMTKIWDEGRAMGGADAKQIFDEISRYMVDFLKMKKERYARG